MAGQLRNRVHILAGAEDSSPEPQNQSPIKMIAGVCPEVKQSEKKAD
jgi:hypothetical protein